MQKFLNKKTLLLIIILVLAGVVGLLYYNNYYKKEKENGQKQQNEKQEEIQIKERFENKIIYQQNQELEKIRKHCEELGGKFNECGSPCSPKAEVCAEVCAYTCDFQKEEPGGKNGEIINWEEFNSQEFSFRLKHPADWEMKFEEGEISPKLTFYPPGEESENPPFDHFKNATHVSVYPKGIPTEGLLGETEELAINLDKNISSESKSYVLENGDKFARYIKFNQVPDSWGEAGFVWSRVKIQDFNSKCLRDGQEIGQQECDPLLNEDKIIRSGSIEENLWQIEEDIIKSFQFTIPVNPEGSSGPIILENPQPNQKISSPLTVTGQAPGTWFFEAEFPIALTDWDGKIIAETQVKAQGNQMTEELVGFEAQIEFKKPFTQGDPDYMKRGNLILQKANPSGLSKNDDAKEIVVFFE